MRTVTKTDKPRHNKATTTRVSPRAVFATLISFVPGSTCSQGKSTAGRRQRQPAETGDPDEGGLASRADSHSPALSRSRGSALSACRPHRLAARLRHRTTQATFWRNSPGRQGGGTSATSSSAPCPGPSGRRSGRRSSRRGSAQSRRSALAAGLAALAAVAPNGALGAARHLGRGVSRKRLRASAVVRECPGR
jgi:hypothetical protein